MVPLGSILISWLLLAIGSCYGNNEKVEVVGFVECSDCGKNNNVKINRLFSGLHVTIDCKFGDDNYKTKGATKLDEEGKFKLSLTNSYVTPNDELRKQDCFVNLHSSFGAQCVNSHSKQKSSKLIFVSESNGKLTLGLNEKLKFSIATCTSAFLWHFKCPPLPHLPTWPKFSPHRPTKSSFSPPPSPPPVYENTIPPPFSQPKMPTPQPAPVYKHFVQPPSPSPTYDNTVPLPALKLCPPTTPTFEKPLPPPSPSPVFNNPAPSFKKPLPPPIPVSKKPLPPPGPTFKKPLIPSPGPTYKHPLPPPIPRFQKPLSPPIPPFRKHLPPLAPTYKKPFPPPTPIFSSNPPIPKKSYPTFPKPPPVPSFPPIPSVPRKFFNKPNTRNQPLSPP